MHSRRFRADREAQGHDRRLDDQADLRAGAAGDRRPGNAARLRRRSGRRIEEFTNPLDATAGRRSAGWSTLERVAEERRAATRPRSNWSIWSSPSRSPPARRSSSIRSAAASSGSSFRRARSRSTSAIAAHVEPIQYEVYGYLPGSYRTVPTVVRNAYRPEQLAVSAPKSLAVLPSGAKSADPYRLTPQRAVRARQVPLRQGRPEDGRRSI